MSGFIAVGVILTLAAVLCVVVPLARRRKLGDGASQVASTNLALLRDQLAELQADLGRGSISAEHYASARAELERRALEEGVLAQDAKSAAPSAGRWTAAALGILVPVILVRHTNWPYYWPARRSWPRP